MPNRLLSPNKAKDILRNVCLAESFVKWQHLFLISPSHSRWLTESAVTGFYVKPTNTPVISGSGGINKSRFCGLKPKPSSFCCSALWVPAHPVSWGFGGACCRSGITTKRWNEEHRWGPPRGAGKIQQLLERGCETRAVQASTQHSLWINGHFYPFETI